MESKLSQKQIGRRIMGLRKNKGLSQEDLAKHIGMSRPSLAQTELGKRTIDLLELMRLSQALEFSLDEFVSPDFGTDNVLPSEVANAEKKPDIRIAVPALKVNKLKQVLLYILERCAGKPNVGATVLNKMLYFCDFNYYELYEEHLTGARYKKLPYGPAPQRLDTIINQMMESGQLKRIKTSYQGYIQTRYIPLEKPDLKQLSAAEKTVTDNVIQLMSDWNASKISEYAHGDMPWIATKDNDYISYNLAFYRELPYSVRIYEDEN